MKKVKLKVAVMLVVVLMFNLLGCSSNESSQESSDVKQITLLTYMAGENVGATFFLPQIERFNELYEGVYEIIIEETPESGYSDKIQQLAQQGSMPVLVHSPIGQGVDEQWFLEVAVENDWVYDLSEFVEGNEVIKDTIIEESLEFCTIDGVVTCMPMTVVRPIGLYYNEALYTTDSDIGDMSMDEFISSLGDNTIAFQTEDDAWTTALFLAVLIANEEGGSDLLENAVTDKLYDYTDEAFVSAVENLQSIIQNYGSSNSVGASYADAANAFMSNSASFIANGTWMVSEFEEGGEGSWSNGFDGSTVATSVYPGNYVVGNTSSYGDFFVSNTASEDEIEVALAFLEFRNSQDEIEAYILAEGGIAPNLEYSEEFLEAQQETPLLAQLTEQINEETEYVIPLYDVLPTTIANSEFGKYLTKLIDGTLTAEEFCEELTKKAQELL